MVYLKDTKIYFGLYLKKVTEAKETKQSYLLLTDTKHNSYYMVLHQEIGIQRFPRMFLSLHLFPFMELRSN